MAGGTPCRGYYPAAGISIGAAPAYQITTRSSSGMNISPSVILNAS